jgi:hypothetical protein
MARPTPVPVRQTVFAIGLFCLSGLLAASVADAQHHVVAAPMPMQARPLVRTAPAPAAPAHLLTPQPSHTVARSHIQTRPATRTSGEVRDRRSFTCANGTNISVANLVNPTPPYGFDYQYLNSINADAGLKATIDPATEVQLREAARLGCGAIGGGGYLLWGGGYGYAPPEQQDVQQDPAPAAQPQVIVVQVPQSQTQSAAKPGSSTEQDDNAALPDKGQFVLVMRDGTQVNAAAFTRSQNTIVYITPDGARRTVMLSDLDTAATVRLNGERGTQLQLSL